MEPNIELRKISNIVLKTCMLPIVYLSNLELKGKYLGRQTVLSCNLLADDMTSHHKNLVFSNSGQIFDWDYFRNIDILVDLFVFDRVESTLARFCIFVIIFISVPLSYSHI